MVSTTPPIFGLQRQRRRAATAQSDKHLKGLLRGGGGEMIEIFSVASVAELCLLFGQDSTSGAFLLQVVVVKVRQSCQLSSSDYVSSLGRFLTLFSPVSKIRLHFSHPKSCVSDLFFLSLLYYYSNLMPTSLARHEEKPCVAKNGVFSLGEKRASSSVSKKLGLKKGLYQNRADR